MQTKLDEKSPTESQIKPRFQMYDLHSLHGQFSSCHFVISSLKARNDISFLNSLGAIFQIFRPRKEILSVPQKKNPTFGASNCKNSRKL